MVATLDRLMPVVALSLALFLQGLVGTGAAATLITPELSAPDGTLLTFADICNSGGTGAGDHCHACTHPLPVDMPAASTPPLTQTAIPCGRVMAPGRLPLPRPEATHSLTTGPPTLSS
jgi:hypothetical protein